MGWGAAAMGVSALVGAKQASDVGKANVSDIRQQGKATQNTIKSRAEAVRFSQFQTANQLKQMEEVLGDKMSMSGLESLQREATLKAATAETGTEGTNQREAIYNNEIALNFTNAAAVRDMSVASSDSKMGLVAELLNFKHGGDALIFGQRSAESAGYQASSQAGQAFQSGFGTTYQMLSGLGGGASTTGANPSAGQTTGFENVFKNIFK